jgi:SAM-dependent methyltransferase
VGVLSDEEDAFGAALLAQQRGEAGVDGVGLVLERDDGWSGPAMGAADFFAPADEWLWWERELLDGVGGPVLDLGCGAGRHALHVQERGLRVTGVDISPGAVAVCRARGVHDVRLGDLRDPPESPEPPESPGGRGWATVLLLCGNLGLAGGWDETRGLLRRLHRLTTPDAVLVTDTVDPTLTDDEEHLAYMRDVEERGLPVGLVRLRLRYGHRVTPWWDLLNVPSRDVEALVHGTGWDLERHVDEGVDQAIRLRRRPA